MLTTRTIFSLFFRWRCYCCRLHRFRCKVFNATTSFTPGWKLCRPIILAKLTMLSFPITPIIITALDLIVTPSLMVMVYRRRLCRCAIGVTIRRRRPFLVHLLIHDVTDHDLLHCQYRRRRGGWKRLSLKHGAGQIAGQISHYRPGSVRPVHK